MMRKASAVVILVLAAYCLLLTIVGFFRVFAVAHAYRVVHGHPAAIGYMSATEIFMILTIILYLVGFKLWPKQTKQRE
jgi:hypothetical protein